MSTTRGKTFPLVPRHRFAGAPSDGHRSQRRGIGDDAAGIRPYRRGDPISAIDWRGSARLSTARGADEWLVRETFASESPRVAILSDRSPSMSLYPPPLPWLDKRAAAGAALEVIGTSALASRSELGYLDHAGGTPHWLPPGGPGREGEIRRRHESAAFDAPDRALQLGLDLLRRQRTMLPAGSFLFVVSDFLTPVRDASWVALRALHWDVVPVIVQDPTWERSFPAAAGVVLPVAGTSGRAVGPLRLRRRDAIALKQANEERVETLRRSFRRLGFESVDLDSSDPVHVLQRFLEWARQRRLRERRLR